MSRFQRVLIAPSVSAIDGLATLASLLQQNHGAHITFVGVVPAPTRLQSLLQPADTLSAAEEQSVRETKADLEALASRVGALDCDLMVRVGRTSEVLLEVVAETNPDLVVTMSDDGAGQDPDTKALLRRCPCPLWVVNPGRTSHVNILAAVNPDPAEVDLNRSIIDHAAELRKVIGGELFVVAAWEFYGESALRHSAFLHTPEDEIERILETEHRAHRQILDDLVKAADLHNSDARIYMARGRPDEVVADAIDRFDIGHLVLGTVARRGLSGWFFGNTAERLVDRTEASLFAIKPPGFPTP